MTAVRARQPVAQFESRVAQGGDARDNGKTQPAAFFLDLAAYEACAQLRAQGRRHPGAIVRDVPFYDLSFDKSGAIVDVLEELLAGAE